MNKTTLQTKALQDSNEIHIIYSKKVTHKYYKKIFPVSQFVKLAHLTKDKSTDIQPMRESDMHYKKQYISD